jgi:hypothetical protein
MTEFKMTKEVLMDNFAARGNDLEELKNVIDTMNKHTRFIKMKSGDLNLLSMIGEGTKDINKADGTIEHDVEVIMSLYLIPGSLPTIQLDKPLDSIIKAYRKPTEADGLLEEWVNKTKLAIIHNENDGRQSFYFTSGSALQTMDRFGISGECLLTPCFERDLLLAKRFELDRGVTAIVRQTEDGKFKKIFTILSDKYTHIDQTVLFDIIKQIEDAGEMGECKCHLWEINNFFTKLYVEFPKKAEELSALYGLSTQMIPGILITTSDTGDASFSVKGTWRAEDSNYVSINSEVKRKHSGEVDILKLVDEVTNKIFAEYAKVPEALCNLMAQDITDVSWDLKTSAGIKANQAEIENVYKAVFKRLGIVKAIGKKTEKVLRQAMVDEINPSIRYTAYDICMLIMTLPERVVFMDKDKDISALQKACGQAPFVSYDIDTTVVLT